MEKDSSGAALEHGTDVADDAEGEGEKQGDGLVGFK